MHRQIAGRGVPVTVLSVCLFGKFDVRRGERRLAGLEARKVQELLCYLLLHRGRPHAREVLASLLWGDNTTSQSRKYLRQALWQLQAALASQSELLGDTLLLVEPDWVQLSPEADFWLDVAEFERAFDTARGLSARELDSQHVQRLRAAADLYQGDLLEGWYQDWCLYERERLQNMYLSLLDKLMDYCEVHHEYEAGLAYGACILRYDRAHERTHRRLMRLHYLSGDRTTALRQYQRCIVALKEDLNVGPAGGTVALHEQVRGDRLDTVIPLAAEGRGSASGMTAPLREVLGRLRQLQGVMTDVQGQLQRDIHLIQGALTKG